MCSDEFFLKHALGGGDSERTGQLLLFAGAKKMKSLALNIHDLYHRGWTEFDPRSMNE